MASESVAQHFSVFISNLGRAYSSSGLIFSPPANIITPYSIQTPKDFVQDRQIKVARLYQPSIHDETSQAYLAEWVCQLALAGMLERANRNYRSDLAPPFIEAGTIQPRRKGVDIVISDMTKQNDNIILGVNIKLRRTASANPAGKQVYDPLLEAPAINLLLGRFNITTRNNTTASIRQWLRDFIIPSILSSGKIPFFNEFQGYIGRRIQKTLAVYLHKAERYMQGELKLAQIVPSLFPTNNCFYAFFEKLALSQRLFEEINHH